MASSPRSRKNKGKRLQNAVRDVILEQFSELESDDVLSTTMGESGTDIKLSPAARKLFPFSIECKNQEKLNIWSSWEQAVKNCKENTVPLLIFKRNHSDIMVSLKFEDFIKLYTS